MANWLSDRTLLGVAVFVVLASLFWSWNGGAGFSAAATVTPASSFCTDSDNGYNTAVAGTCSDDSGTYEDTCTSGRVVGERFCSASNQCGKKLMQCGYNQQCTKGKCV